MADFEVGSILDLSEEIKTEGVQCNMSDGYSACRLLERLKGLVAA
jgi:hypothetical protein